jgi:hypothetical protein
MRRTLLTTMTVGALLLTACGADETPEAEPPAQEQDTAAEEAEAEEEADTAEEEAAVEEAEPEPEEAEAEEADPLPDVPAAYTSIYQEGVEPTLETVDGEVTVAAIAAVDDSGSFPMIIHNGTDQPISRVEVSGAAVDADGATVSSGSSQGFEPNVIEPGGIAIGYVYAGYDLPANITLEQINVDYTTGLGSFENIFAVDVTEVSVSPQRVTGTISNPHDVEVSGPISVGMACLDDSGTLIAVAGSFADRDGIEAGGTSTFTIDFYGSEMNCAGVILGSSGYED